MHSIQIAVGEVVFIKPQIVAEFVEQGASHFFAVELGVVMDVFPDVLKIQNDLRGQGVRAGVGIREGFADEEAEGVGLNLFSLYFGRWHPLADDGHGAGLFAQEWRKRAKGFVDFMFRFGEEASIGAVGEGHDGAQHRRGRLLAKSENVSVRIFVRCSFSLRDSILMKESLWMHEKTGSGCGDRAGG